jgi:hypothetical protein
VRGDGLLRGWFGSSGLRQADAFDQTIDSGDDDQGKQGGRRYADQ